MKSTLTFVMIFCLQAAAAAVGLAAEKETRPISDTKIAEQLLGTWLVESTPSPGTTIRGAVTFTKDGKFTSKATIERPTGTTEISYEGAWEVKGGYIIEKVKKTTDTKLATVGHVSRDYVIKIDERELVYRTEKGKTVKRTRSK